ncbi:TetR/AcrR family transcriptional regulator [Yinghuangia soli]|uniref:TetR family transcriptional regulator n=1 Tax=Yinghuangia soli TaxID=2908204 RepID=A0AA41U0H7_9ACTN|nr:TetR family transcriptional regulator [Yinghuangia soli]MCF2528450.1 TetR family transcriptional regulator [Yinghuangia soli]
MAAPGDAPERRGPGRPAGRRTGAPDTRRQILEAARTEFARSGYEGTSVRGIARSAGVDPALVHHYFGPKEHVFIAALDLPFDPDALVPELTTDGPDRMGERLARYFFALWEEPDIRPRMLAMLRTVLSGTPAAGLIKEFMTHEMIGRVVRELGVRDAALRANLCTAQLMGVAFTRYVLCLEPIASADPEVLTAEIAPTLQRYLQGA